MAVDFTKPFAVKAIVYKTDADGQRITEDSKPIVDHEVGDFMFRLPTVRDRIEIERRKAEMTGGHQLSDAADIYADALSRLPVLCTSAPKNWVWDFPVGKEDDLMAIYAAFAEEAGRFRSSGDEKTA
jgi:hypothetical protein